jgi:hypothetical protein
VPGAPEEIPDPKEKVAMGVRILVFLAFVPVRKKPTVVPVGQRLRFVQLFFTL